MFIWDPVIHLKWSLASSFGFGETFFFFFLLWILNLLWIHTDGYLKSNRNSCDNIEKTCNAKIYLTKPPWLTRQLMFSTSRQDIERAGHRLAPWRRQEHREDPCDRTSFLTVHVQSQNSHFLSVSNSLSAVRAPLIQRTTMWPPTVKWKKSGT